MRPTACGMPAIVRIFVFAFNVLSGVHCQMLPLTNLILEIEGIISPLFEIEDTVGRWIFKRKISRYPKQGEYWYTKTDSFMYVDDFGVCRLVVNGMKPNIRLFIK